MQYHLTAKSSNTKTGKIPVSTTSRDSCPNSCPLKDKACYGDSGFHLSMHWTKVSDSERGIGFATFCESIAKIKPGQLWRHNQAGDLPGVNETIDLRKLAQLVTANGASKGFTYTHKKRALRTAKGLKAVKDSNSKGFTINVSADNDSEVDEFRAKGLPVAVVVAEDSQGYTTSGGNKVKICPAQLSERKNADGTFKVTCKSCGLCQLANRPHVVGFRAHGTKKALVQLG